MSAEKVDRYSLVDRVMSHGGLDRAKDALRAIRATAAVLGERLPVEGKDALARALPRTLGSLVRACVAQRAFDLDDLYDRVRAREGVSEGFAREHAQAVCASLGELLPAEVKQILDAHLPPPIAELFHTREVGEPPPHGTARAHTLASGRPGSAHPISESAPRGAQAHSVVRETNPHGETKLSSASGLTQERTGESLASSRPSTRRRISESKD
jgi:uncharacterized protein (DUF2267 family)